MEPIELLKERLAELNSLISNIKLTEDRFNQRLEVILVNNYIISVINGRGAICDHKTFEVAVLDQNYEMDYTLFDDVLGYQSIEDVMELIKKVATI